MVVHSKKIVIQNSYIANEIPSEVIDGINKDFTIINSPVSNSVLVRLSGLVQVPGLLKDYTLSGQTISFIKAPKIGQEVAISYLY